MEYLPTPRARAFTAHPRNFCIYFPPKQTLFSNIHRSGKRIASAPDSELILYPGSVIFVPRGIDNSATNRLAAQAYVSILGNIGIALASLSSINNN